MKQSSLLSFIKTIVKYPYIINNQLLKSFSIFDEGNEKKKQVMGVTKERFNLLRLFIK